METLSERQTDRFDMVRLAAPKVLLSTIGGTFRAMGAHRASALMHISTKADDSATWNLIL